MVFFFQVGVENRNELIIFRNIYVYRHSQADGSLSRHFTRRHHDLSMPFFALINCFHPVVDYIGELRSG